MTTLTKKDEAESEGAARGSPEHVCEACDRSFSTAKALRWHEDGWHAEDNLVLAAIEEADIVLMRTLAMYAPDMVGSESGKKLMREICEVSTMLRRLLGEAQPSASEGGPHGT